MSKSKFITVTVISTNIKEEILDDIIGEEGPKDEHGRTREYYLDMGFTESNLPEFFRNKEQKKIIDLTDPGMYDYVAREGKIRPKLIDFMIDNEDKGCKLYLVTGHTVIVEESVKEIELKINKRSEL